MTRPERSDWWITVAVNGDLTRTRDYRICARNAYNAGWLWRLLHPGQRIVHIRPTTPHHDP